MAMEKQTRESRRREKAILFLLAACVVPVVVGLAWGPLHKTAPPGLAPPPPAALAPEPSFDSAVALGEEDQQYLMSLFLDSLKPSGPAAGDTAAPEACRRVVDRTVFVTLYAPDQRPLRASAREKSLQETVQVLARRVLSQEEFQKKGFDRTEQLRVRFDIVTEEQDLPLDRREQFALLGVGAPLGIVLRFEGRGHAFLPDDVAERSALSYMDMFEALSREAELLPGSWREKQCHASVLRAESFVNSAPGSSNCLSLLRGLPLIREAGIAQVRRSCRLAADYLVHTQREDGSFAAVFQAATGSPEAGGDLRSQARAVSALARFCSWQGEKDGPHITSCRGALAWLLRHVYAPKDVGIAFVRSSEGEAPSLRDSAAVLHALCAYRQAAGDETLDDLIARLGNFLLFSQQEDGSFGSVPAPGTDKATPPESPRPDWDSQAEAAGALALVYGELKAPQFLLGSRKALDYLKGQREVSEQLQSARSYVTAVRELSRFLPVEAYTQGVRTIVERLLEMQLTAEEAPTPDLAGGAMRAYPPLVGETAADLECFLGGWLIAASSNEAGTIAFSVVARPAALNAGRYLVQFQFLPENSYYLAEPVAALGGFRQQPGSNLITLESVQQALDGLRLLAQAMLVETRESK